MKKIYSNLPANVEASAMTADSAMSTVQYFDQFYNAPVDVDNNMTTAIKAYFTKRGFDSQSAESTALVLVTQAKTDNIPATRLLDTLSGLTDVELSSLITEILNYNRFKTSKLGMFISSAPADEVQRNILP